MTLDEAYNQNKGTAILIPGGGVENRGQCVQWADLVLHNVYGQSYHYANAAQWWTSPGELVNAFSQVTDGTIKKGDIVVFSENLPGAVGYGHICVAAQDGSRGDFISYDSHWTGHKDANGYPILETIHHNAGENKYVYGSLRLKGSNMDRPTIDSQFILGRNTEATNEEVAYWGSEGRTVLQLATAIKNSPWNDQFRYKAIHYDEDVAKAAQTNYDPYSGDPLFTKKKGK